MGHWAVDNSFVEFVLENVLLNWETILEILNREFAHVHNCSNVELINPVSHLIDS